MKKLFIFSALLVAFIGFSTCGGKKDKESSDTGIISFKVGTDEWLPGGGIDFTCAYQKGTNVSNLTPIIKLSHSKAKYVPTGSVDFSDNRTVTFTVTAENGSTKDYTAKATVLTQ